MILKKALTILVLVGIIFSMGLASAQDDNLTERTKSRFNFIDAIIDNLRYSFASQENKMEVGLEIMDERISEIKASNNSNQIERIERNRQRIIDKLENAGLNETQKEQIRERIQLQQRQLASYTENKSHQSKLALNLAINQANKNLKQFSPTI